MQLPIFYDVDIRKPLQPTRLQPMLVARDAGAHRVGVRLFEGQTPYCPGGVCAGFVVRRDGYTVPIDGVIDGNEMYVDLPAAAYALDGPVSIGIKNRNGDAETTVFLAVGTVLCGETDTVIDPEAVIPSLPVLFAQLQRALAPAFSADSAYAVGDWVWKDGQLYRAKAASVGDWDEARFEPAAVTADLLRREIAGAAEAMAYLAGEAAATGGRLVSLDALKAAHQDAKAHLEASGAAIAPVETGGASAHNYAIGDWLIWKNALYKATATIAAGDPLAVGTNLAAASVSAEVATVKTDLAKASAGLLTPEQALTKRTYIQNGSFSYSSRSVEIQDGVITYTGRASGGTNWITIFISGSFSTSTKGIAEVVPPVSSCLPIALLDSVTHLQLYRETDVPGALWFAVFFCGVDENENVTVLHVVRPAMTIAEGAGPLKTVGPLLIPEGTTHFAIGFYSTVIADLRNTTTKVIPLFRTFPANE